MMNSMKKFIFCISFILVSNNLSAVVVVDEAENSSSGLFNNTKKIEDIFSGINALAPNLKSVISLYNQGETIKAKDMISKILSKNPSDPQALHVAGTIFLQEKRYENAQVAFEAALKSEVKNPVILSKLGVTRLLKGDRDKGRRILNLALNLDPNEQLALRYLAWLAESDGLHNLVVEYCTRLLDISRPTSLTNLHISLARAYSKTRQFKEVIKVLEPVIEAKSGNDGRPKSFAMTLLIDSYIQTTQFNKASLLMEKASKGKLIGAVQVAVFNIELLIKQKKFSQAQNFIEKTVKSDPENEHIYRYAASQGFSEVAEYNLAIKQLTAVVKYLEAGKDKNKLFSALNDLTALYIKAERKIDALRVMQEYAKKYSNSQKLLYQLAELQTSSGQFARAKNNLDKLLNIDISFVSAYYLKGVIARRQKQFANAEKWFSKANQMDPKFENAWIQRSGSFIDADKNKEALSVLVTATQKNRTSALLWFELGALLTEMERHEEAIPAYKAVLSLAPNHLPSIDNLAGSLLVLEKDLKQALYFSEKAYQMDPSDKVLQLNYLEALLLNKRFKLLLKEAKKLESGLKDSGRFHYLVGAAYLKSGNKDNGVKHLTMAGQDSSLGKKYTKKIAGLLKN